MKWNRCPTLVSFAPAIRAKIGWRFIRKTAAVRAEGDDGRDRFRRDDFLSSKRTSGYPGTFYGAQWQISSADRQAGPPREDLPLPTAPPYTSFVGNLAFDISEDEMIEYFGPRVCPCKSFNETSTDYLPLRSNP